MARKVAQLPDWIFSASNKRRVIAYVVASQNQGKVLGERELARALDVDLRGSIDEHLFALAQLGLLKRRERPRRFQILSPDEMTTVARDLSDALGNLVDALKGVDDVPLDRP
jgi:hypothetical protein